MGINRIILLILGTILISFINGCSSKEYSLFQDSMVYENNCYLDENISFENKINPGDRLSIEIVNIYNQNINALEGSQSFSQNLNMTSNSLLNSNSGYLVDKRGRVFLPLLGYVKVADCIIPEANLKLTKAYKKYLKHPFVKVNILNQRVYILGEVRKPGMVSLLNETMTIYEAIARAGGLTDYAKRNSIKILNANDKMKKIRTVDLTRLSSLNSMNIILKPNDIVYIMPRDMKGFNVGVKETLPILQAISSALSPFVTLKYLNE